jgi:hypothetical protein
MPEHRPSVFASASLPRHLARGALGFGLLISALALAASAGPASLLLAPAGFLALRGCPTCWTLGLIETISAGRLQRRCAEQGCALGRAPRRQSIVAFRAPAAPNEPAYRPPTNGEQMLKRARRRRTMFAALAAIAVLSAASASTILGAANLTTIRAGNLVIKAEGVISPQVLPKNKLAPISLHVRTLGCVQWTSQCPPEPRTTNGPILAGCGSCVAAA